MKKIKQLIFKMCLSFVDAQTKCNNTPLTEDDLTDMGWIRLYEDRTDRYYFTEPNIKERDKIWVSFENHYYRIYHGMDKTFIALRISKAWFDVYYMLHKRP